MNQAKMTSSDMILLLMGTNDVRLGIAKTRCWRTCESSSI